MKIREFNVLNYNIVQKVKEYIYKNTNLAIVENVDAYLTNIYGISIKVNGKDITDYKEKDKKILFEVLSKNMKEYIISEFKREYEEKTKQTIDDFNKIKKQTDFMFYDDKEYKELCKILENALYCQATIALRDFMDKKLKSKATKNIKYFIRNQEYMNITCD